MNYGPNHIPPKQLSLPAELVEEIDKVIIVGLNRRSMVCLLLREALDQRYSHGMK